MTEWFKAIGYRSHTTKPKKYEEIVLYIKAENPAEALSIYGEIRGIKKTKSPGIIKHVGEKELANLEKLIDEDRNLNWLEKKRLKYYRVDSSVLSSENEDM